MQKPPLTAMVIFKAKPEKVDDFRKVADQLIRKSRKERGCLEYFIQQSSDYANVFMLYMIWKDEEAFARHVSSPHVQNFDMKQAKELLAEPYIMTRWNQLA